ncbi:uncharacterized protein JN550_005846 [Neoarthrinium moseri]|uniref:uncharacterized protein n=1 Tax=Neoarthrinium moseri TaxID=1658444 RepID=UPI001FDC03F5|nr:uncharacterized protein JN550_005846 [Neoarthrinium moseri]KAI1869216.1 hypothetical protein JN550_005846 [Neoarthrinium moseri]
MYSRRVFVVVGFVIKVACINFNFESTQLQEADIKDFPAIAFGNISNLNSTYDGPQCKVFPESPDWPLDDEWVKLNNTLGGALLKPAPPGAVCYNSSSYYNSDQCTYIVRNAANSRFYINDPLTVLTAWAQGNTCPATLTTQGVCTQGGFPTYVVNATTVKQVQIAVNFARNRNIRLVVKNTGHDFNGRSTGAGALSIWTHNLKSFEYMPQYTQGEYSGRAARVASGLESWEMFPYMALHNMTVVVPSGYTVGPYGGWMAGGGHSLLGSLYGMGADQPLSLQVVTANGRFITADPETNKDLYHALRGGGPGSYGVVTSAIVKAYPPIIVTAAPLSFNLFSGPLSVSSITDAHPSAADDPVTVNDTEAFWSAHNLYYYFGKAVVDDANGATYSYVSRTGNGSYSFRSTFEFPGKTIPQVKAFMQTLISAINDLGVPVKNEDPTVSTSWTSMRDGKGDTPGSSRFSSRIFPQKNWGDKALFNQTMWAIRETVEAGYQFHGIHMTPSEAKAGYPGNNAVNPAFRTGLMHADVFDRTTGASTSPEEVKSNHARLDSYMNKIRAVTPGGGAYVNEADVLEPNWQTSFWGSKYEGLLEIKKRHDPWGLFWAPTTVGSEEWAVRTSDGLPTQNGRLCRV